MRVSMEPLPEGCITQPAEAKRSADGLCGAEKVVHLDAEARDHRRVEPIPSNPKRRATVALVVQSVDLDAVRIQVHVPVFGDAEPLVQLALADQLEPPA